MPERFPAIQSSREGGKMENGKFGSPAGRMHFQDAILRRQFPKTAHKNCLVEIVEGLFFSGVASTRTRLFENLSSRNLAFHQAN